MSALLALVATILTSFLPILNKRLLRDARPALVAWVINAASLPILALGTLLLTQCSITPLHGSIPLTCTLHIPQVDGIFVWALLASALLNWAATLLSTVALAQADASLVSPLLTFNPAFTLLIAWPTLGETPGLRQTFGIAVVLFGTYLLEVEEARTGLLAPIRVLIRRPGTLLAILASALWGTTTVLEKLSIDHMTPPSGPMVALIGTVLLAVLLTPGALRFSEPEEPALAQGTWYGLGTHPRALFVAILLAGVAPLFGFTAIALGLVGYVTTLFKLSAVFTILWARPAAEPTTWSVRDAGWWGVRRSLGISSANGLHCQFAVETSKPVRFYAQADHGSTRFCVLFSCLPSPFVSAHLGDSYTIPEGVHT